MSAAALDFWTGRLDAEGHATERADGSLRFRDFEGLEHELVVSGAMCRWRSATGPRTT